MMRVAHQWATLLWPAYVSALPSDTVVVCVFDVQMFRTNVGHADGDLRPVYILISDHALYMVSGTEKKSYEMKAAVPFREINYIAVRY